MASTSSAWVVVQYVNGALVSAVLAIDADQARGAAQRWLDGHSPELEQRRDVGIGAVHLLWSGVPRRWRGGRPRREGHAP